MAAVCLSLSQDRFFGVDSFHRFVLSSQVSTRAAHRASQKDGALADEADESINQ